MIMAPNLSVHLVKHINDDHRLLTHLKSQYSNQPTLGDNFVSLVLMLSQLGCQKAVCHHHHYLALSLWCSIISRCY